METKSAIQITDPAVSKRKFEAELRKFENVKPFYQEKGIFCTKVLFPDVYFLFTIPKLLPPVIGFAVKINFINYDFEPPSIVFINPFTEAPARREQVPLVFIQINKNIQFQPIDLLQGGGNMSPFFCIPGVREYHNHSAHSGDSWFLYRTRGEGSLLFILDQLYNNSIGTAKSFQIVVNPTEIKVLQEIKFNQ